MCCAASSSPAASVGQPARPQSQRADQAAMHQQVGVAADRACEMRVARQGQPEMADVVRAVGCLRLAAQHHLVDQRRLGRVGHRAQHAVEVARMHLTARRQRHAHPVQEAAQVLQLLLRRRRVDAIDARGVHRSSSSAAATLARIMNSSISRWLSRRRRGSTAVTRPAVVEHDPALRQVEVQRPAPLRGPRAARGTRRRGARAARPQRLAGGRSRACWACS